MTPEEFIKSKIGFYQSAHPVTDLDYEDIENWLKEYFNQSQLKNQSIDWDELEKKFIDWDKEGGFNASQRQILNWFKENFPKFKSVKELTDEEIMKYVTKLYAHDKNLLSHKNWKYWISAKVLEFKKFQSYLLNKEDT